MIRSAHDSLPVWRVNGVRCIAAWKCDSGTNESPGEWIVEALQLIESSTHLKIMAYGLVIAALIYAIRWW